ncbi:hypothetical protein SAMN04489841_3040 [Natrinema salaciae]|uniref:Uncharacterized protein n=1 Tax=Natrinema salaciae TaxID=1186196 RepID=A0A1H9LRF8_9EURY|nr:hypothetical protein SAMN04489841_3040 [Natrinema salaciae]
MSDEPPPTNGASASTYAGNPNGKRFTKIRGAEYDRVNEFLRDRTTFTAREWAIARACQDFRTPTGVPMRTVGENLPDLVPFMTDTYSGQSVSSAKHRFDEKVQMAANTMLYGALTGFYTGRRARRDPLRSRRDRDPPDRNRGWNDRSRDRRARRVPTRRVHAQGSSDDSSGIGRTGRRERGRRDRSRRERGVTVTLERRGRCQHRSPRSRQSAGSRRSTSSSSPQPSQ